MKRGSVVIALILAFVLLAILLVAYLYAVNLNLAEKPDAILEETNGSSSPSSVLGSVDDLIIYSIPDGWSKSYYDQQVNLKSANFSAPEKGVDAGFLIILTAQQKQDKFEDFLVPEAVSELREFDVDGFSARGALVEYEGVSYVVEILNDSAYLTLIFTGRNKDEILSNISIFNKFVDSIKFK